MEQWLEPPPVCVCVCDCVSMNSFSSRDLGCHLVGKCSPCNTPKPSMLEYSTKRTAQEEDE